MPADGSNVQLSPAAKKVAELIDELAGGNQRKFAQLAGCSQPLLSRICSGKQEPGRKLLDRISHLQKHGGIPQFESRKTRPQVTTIPIANSLLDGPPSERGDQLTDETLNVSAVLSRQSLYAVRASACEPSYSDPTERMRADDLVVIDSAVERIRKNAQILHKKLCVVISGSEEFRSIMLRRVWVTYDSTKAAWTIRTYDDAKIDEYHRAKVGTREMRLIQLDLPEDKPAKTEYVDRTVAIEDILGIAVELIRRL